MAGIATASPTKNILLTMSATVFRWVVSAPPRRWPMSSLSWRHHAPTGSTAGTYRSMGWNSPTRHWIDGRFSGFHRKPAGGVVGSAGEGHKFGDHRAPQRGTFFGARTSCARETVGPM